MSQNARKHGLRAKVHLVDEDHESDYQDLERGMINALDPQNEAESLIVEDIAKTQWKIRQADNMEMDLLRDNIEQGDSIHSAFTYDPRSIMLLSTYQGRLHRQLHKLFDQFRKLQWDSMDPKRNPVRSPRPSRDPWSLTHPDNIADADEFERQNRESNLRRELEERRTNEPESPPEAHETPEHEPQQEAPPATLDSPTADRPIEASTDRDKRKRRGTGVPRTSTG